MRAGSRTPSNNRNAGPDCTSSASARRFAPCQHAVSTLRPSDFAFQPAAFLRSAALSISAGRPNVPPLAPRVLPGASAGCRSGPRALRSPRSCRGFLRRGCRARLLQAQPSRGRTGKGANPRRSPMPEAPTYPNTPAAPKTTNTRRCNSTESSIKPVFMRP